MPFQEVNPYSKMIFNQSYTQELCMSSINSIRVFCKVSSLAPFGTRIAILMYRKYTVFFVNLRLELEQNTGSV